MTWQYKVEEWFVMSADEIQLRLNQCGEESWELVTAPVLAGFPAGGIFIFKRSLESL